jgi:hypothetical protein
MNNALGVRGPERIGGLPGVLERFADRKRPPREPLGQRLALDQLHDEVVHAPVMADVVHGTDVRMIERGDGARLALELAPGLGLRAGRRGQNLDRDGPAQTGVVRSIDLAHPAGADGRDDLIGTQTRSGGERARSLRSELVGPHPRSRRLDPLRPPQRGCRAGDPGGLLAAAAALSRPPARSGAAIS